MLHPLIVKKTLTAEYYNESRSVNMQRGCIYVS